jgi:hypothetical protein
LATTAILAVSAFAAPVFADDSDKSVKGLWIEVPNLPKDAEVVDFGMNDEGVVAYTRLVDAPAVAIVVERLNPDSIAYGPEAIAEFVAEAEDIDAGDVAVEAMDDLSGKYSYPVFGANYETGWEDNMRQNADIYIFTDPWVFRLHAVVAEEYADEYMSQVYDWYSNLKLTFRE